MAANSCPSCGAALPDGAGRCPLCARVPAGEGAPSPGRAESGKAPLLVPLAILAVGAAALVIVLLLARGNPPAGEVLSQAPAPAPAEVAAPTAASPKASSPTPTTVPPAVPEETLRAPAAAAPPPPPPTPTPPVERFYECRAGAVFGVDPEEALVEVNGRAIGKADDWDDAGGGKKYLFERPGSYYVRFALAGYRTAWIKIVVRPTAEEEFADVDLELEKRDEAED